MSTLGDVDTADEEEELATDKTFAANEFNIRKSCCRYGRGCTHINDPSHRVKFWHPYAPQFTGALDIPKLGNSLNTVSCIPLNYTGDQLKTHFICNECGYSTPDLKTLQVMLLV